MSDLTELYAVMGSREIAKAAVDARKEQRNREQEAYSKLSPALQNLYSLWKTPRTEEGREAREMIVRGKR